MFMNNEFPRPKDVAALLKLTDAESYARNEIGFRKWLKKVRELYERGVLTQTDVGVAERLPRNLVIRWEDVSTWDIPSSS